MPLSHQTPLLGWLIFMVKDGVFVGISTVHEYIHKLTGENRFGFEKNYQYMANEIRDNITILLKIASKGELLA